MIRVTFLFVFLSTAGLRAGDEWLAKSEAIAEMTDALEFEGLPYRLLKPDGFQSGESRKYPLFLCMHGAGGRGKANRKTVFHSPWALHAVASDYVRKKHPCFVLVPQCPDGKQWVDTPWGKGSYSTKSVKTSGPMSKVMPLVRATMKKYPINPARIYVGGFSMGGYGTWDLVARNPKVFAAAVPVCGGGDPSRAAAIAKSTKVWGWHGDADNVVPVKGTREMVEAMKKANPDSVRYTELKGTQHNAWTPAWSKKELVDWVFAQEK